MSFITDFADQALILPLVLAVAVSLLLQGWRRGAGAWLLAVFMTFAVMVGLKLVFLACARKPRHRRYSARRAVMLPPQPWSPAVWPHWYCGDA